MNAEPQTPIAPQTTTTPQTTVEPQARGPDKHGAFGEVSAERLMAAGAESIPCLWEPMLQQVGIAAVVGSSDTGKSAFLRELTVAVSAGDKEFLGFPLRTRYQRAVYISTEDDERDFHHITVPHIDPHIYLQFRCTVSHVAQIIRCCRHCGCR